MTHSKSEELFRRAVEKIPGGVNSPVRAFRSVGGTAGLHRARRGLAPLRRRWQRVHRLRRLVGTAASRPPASAKFSRRCERALEHRHQLRRAHRAGNRTGRRHLRRRALDRDGAAGQLRHRSHHVGHPRGARLHRARPDRQVRRLLSRPRGFAAGEGRLRHGHARHRRHAGRARRRSPTPPSPCPSIRWRRWKRHSARTATGSPR